MTSPSNPFDASRLRAGIVPYFFAGGTSRQQILDQFVRGGYRGQIVGPHGTGKSTLWLEILDSLRAAGHVIVSHTLRNQANDVQRILQAARHEILAIDGFEQLGLWRRLRCIYRRSQSRLLITTHRRQPGLPILYTTNATVAQLQYVVGQLWQASNLAGATFDEAVAEDRLHDLLARHGSTREALFSLYDWYQQAAMHSSESSRDSAEPPSKCTGAIIPESRD